MKENDDGIGYKILIIEEDEVLTNILKKHLTHQNYSVEAYADSFEGIRKAAEINPDIIILDSEQNTGSGVELNKRLKSNEYLRNIPVLMLSNNNSYYSENTRPDVTEFIQKPVDIAELTSKIERYMRK